MIILWKSWMGICLWCQPTRRENVDGSTGLRTRYHWLKSWQHTNRFSWCLFHYQLSITNREMTQNIFYCAYTVVTVTTVGFSVITPTEVNRVKEFHSKNPEVKKKMSLQVFKILFWREEGICYFSNNSCKLKIARGILLILSK